LIVGSWAASKAHCKEKAFGQFDGPWLVRNSALPKQPNLLLKFATNVVSLMAGKGGVWFSGQHWWSDSLNTNGAGKLSERMPEEKKKKKKRFKNSNS
jgi:hypothetical protein